MMSRLRVERCFSAGNDDWLRLRCALWPEGTASEHRQDLLAMQADQFSQSARNGWEYAWAAFIMALSLGVYLLTIQALTGGQIDAIMASMSITAEREKVIDFSDKYYNTPTVVVAAKGSGITPTPEGLAGKIIGVQVSTIHEAYAKAHFPDAELKTYQTTDEGFQDLAAGRIDASQADSIAIDAFMATDTGKACCEVVGAVADDPAILGAGVGVGLRKGETELKDKFNAAIKKIREDGTYDEITKKYFASSIYGG